MPTHDSLGSLRYFQITGLLLCGWLSFFVINQVEAGSITDFAEALPSPMPRARWSEEWLILRDTTPSHEDPSLAFKYIPLNKSGTNYLSLGGEFRFAYEDYDPVDRGLSDIGNQNVPLLRMAAHADWHLNPVVASLWSARLCGCG